MIVLGKAGPRKVGLMERAYGNGKAGSDSHSAEGKRKMPLFIDLSPAACNQQQRSWRRVVKKSELSPLPKPCAQPLYTTQLSIRIFFINSTAKTTS
jgi:hypothetical protein